MVNEEKFNENSTQQNNAPRIAVLAMAFIAFLSSTLRARPVEIKDGDDNYRVTDLTDDGIFKCEVLGVGGTNTEAAGEPQPHQLPCDEHYLGLVLPQIETWVTPQTQARTMAAGAGGGS